MFGSSKDVDKDSNLAMLCGLWLNGRVDCHFKISNFSSQTMVVFNSLVRFALHITHAVTMVIIMWYEAYE